MALIPRLFTRFGRSCAGRSFSSAACAAQADALAAQRREVVEEHKRRFREVTDPIPESQRWLHAGPLSGTQRAFTNLAVLPDKIGLLSSLALPPPPTRPDQD
jgi:hypothetical protein